MFKEKLTRLGISKKGRFIKHAGKGNYDKVKKLLDEGVNPNSITDTGYSALMAASTYGHILIVSLLLEKDVDLEQRYSDGKTALMGAVAKGQIETTKALLNAGANPNVKEFAQGCTPLHLAADQNEAELIDLLVQSGADVDIGDKIGKYSPLMYAVFQENVEATDALMAAGANPKKNGTDGETPLQLARMKRNRELIMKLLPKED